MCTQDGHDGITEYSTTATFWFFHPFPVKQKIKTFLSIHNSPCSTSQTSFTKLTKVKVPLRDQSKLYSSIVTRFDLLPFRFFLSLGVLEQAKVPVERNQRQVLGSEVQVLLILAPLFQTTFPQSVKGESDQNSVAALSLTPGQTLTCRASWCAISCPNTVANPSWSWHIGNIPV